MDHYKHFDLGYVGHVVGHGTSLIQNSFVIRQVMTSRLLCHGCEICRENVDPPQESYEFDMSIWMSCQGEGNIGACPFSF